MKRFVHATKDAFLYEKQLLTGGGFLATPRMLSLARAPNPPTPLRAPNTSPQRFSRPTSPFVVRPSSRMSQATPNFARSPMAAAARNKRFDTSKFSIAVDLNNQHEFCGEDRCSTCVSITHRGFEDGDEDVHNVDEIVGRHRLLFFRGKVAEDLFIAGASRMRAMAQCRVFAEFEIVAFYTFEIATVQNLSATIGKFLLPCVEDGQEVVTGVLLPINDGNLPKGQFRQGVRRPVSLVIQPFSDAEVFQLFALQISWRLYFGVVFEEMTYKNYLRADQVLSQKHRAPIAFEFPNGEVQELAYLVFPGNSSTLSFFQLEKARATGFDEEQHLFGGFGLPCITSLGKSVANWSLGVKISSELDAFVALNELFAKFHIYKACRSSVLAQFPVPKLFATGKKAMSRMAARVPEFFPLSTACLVEPRITVDDSTPKLDGGRPYYPVMTLPSAEDLSLPKAPFFSPFTRTVTLVNRWEQYVECGQITLFENSVDQVMVLGYIGEGGSGLVFEGTYGPQRLPVAIKCFIYPDGFSYEQYVRESLTDVAFFVLFNQLDDFGICHGVRAHDFIISRDSPVGMDEKFKTRCHHNNPDPDAKLCYLITDLMDGTLGRFLTETDENYDPCYDEIVNTPLCEGELFQFLYSQLILRMLFDYQIHDIMLNGQLRGDNLGFRYLSGDSGSVDGSTKRIFQFDAMYYESRSNPGTFVRFPTANGSEKGMRSIFFIDVGQGLQKDVEKLTERNLIGKTIAQSCVDDDNLGRYWPPDRLYASGIECNGELAKEVLNWAASRRVATPTDADEALTELFAIYSKKYETVVSSEDWSEEGLGEKALVFSSTEKACRSLRKSYVYQSHS